MEEPSTTTTSSSSSSSSALSTTLSNSIQALGRGFDVTSDIRLLYCKGAPGSRLIQIDENHTRDLVISEGGGGIVLPNVSIDIEYSPGKSFRDSTPVCTFHEMAEFFNMNSSISGDIPLGSFNSMFNFTGSWPVDAAATKTLAMDGYFIPLFKVRLAKLSLVLHDEIKRAVPYSWDPSSLASFIENFGTHIITSATVGGRDVVYVKQHQSSLLSALEIEKYVQDIGDKRFLDLENQPSGDPFKYNEKASLCWIFPFHFLYLYSFRYYNTSLCFDVTVIFRRRGGDDLVQSHAKWVETVHLAPDVINMTFSPIVSLLKESAGIKHLARAIDLYLKYKPPIEELQYFLEFQIPRVWAPEQSNLPGYQRKEPVCQSLQFSLMGPKLYVSSDQITVGRKPVTGLRLCLEGSKQNRLAIHLQHLVSLPKILQPHWDAHMAIGAPKWHGPEEQDSRWFEPIKWKNFSHVSTAPIEHNETYIGDLSGVHIVTGAQLGVWEFGAKSVLHLKLLFSKVPGCTIRRSVWDHKPTNTSQLNSVSSSSSNERNSDDKKADSSSQIGKLTKIIDLTEMSKGPQDVPGHWLVTGAKLGVEKGKIVLRVKYSLLNY
ncbi:Membrane attack complex component/perforin (MACPF) domain [Macleaya cordata]|uniref:Membrane attack complex component/perforin (MACPF) domain n=1 Tax=Macleaya cordata TaxID=56857 RepID=A0A200PTC8_MACCD|nr:Membrane attack complex component/perforin (MACPF) domain [Macleaya cordata]